MDLQTVFYAASFGNLTRLKKILFQKSQPEIQTVVSAITDGTTPLIMACQNGHLDIVLYLVETCGADVMQEGSYVHYDYESNEVVEGVTPLWCAAKSGNFYIVQALIKFKASINVTSNQPISLSPLFAALWGCSNQVLNLLVGEGADVNAKGKNGRTLLHSCAEVNIPNLAKFLLEYGAKFYEDDFGVSPLLLAASKGNMEMANFFMEEFKLPELEIIHAMELLGANKIDSENDPTAALDYWQKATILRYQDNERPLPKQLTSNSPIGVEFRTLDQLSDLFLDADVMRIQALLIRERIFGVCHEDTIEQIAKTGHFFIDQGDVHLGNRLLIHAADRLQSLQQPLDDLISIILTDICGRFYAMVTKDLVLSFQDVLHAFKISATDIEIASEREDILENTDSMMCYLHIIAIMCQLKKVESEKCELMVSVYENFKLNTRNVNGDSLLHLACSEYKMEFDNILAGTEFLFPSFSVATILLEVGLSSNARNMFGDTPLHYVARSDPCNFKIVQLLLEHGAHLDAPNFRNETPLHFLKDKPTFDLLPLKYLNLRCLCSQVINTHRIPYTGQVPETLKTFVDMHCAEEFE